MKKIIWVLRLGIVAFGAALVFESIKAPKHTPAPRIYIVNPAAEKQLPATARGSKQRVELPHEGVHTPQMAPLAEPRLQGS